MKTILPLLGAAALFACSQQPVATGDTVGDVAMHHPVMNADPDDPEATRGYKQSMAAMMADAPAFTGDPDVDFMQQMRAHHVAAVAMARTELAHGKDAEARRLAEVVIAAQRQEIAQIDRWLAGRRQ